MDESKSIEIPINQAKTPENIGPVDYWTRYVEKTIARYEKGETTKGQLVEELSGQIREQARKASIDGLTGFYNKYAFEVHYYELLDHSEETGEALSLVMMDLDGLKEINDKYGHDQGNMAILSVADAIDQYTDDQDVKCRWGGDEFVIIFPNCSLHEVEAIAANILSALHEKFVGAKYLTASMGVGQVSKIKAEGIEDMFKKIDIALYRAKEQGRNQIFSAEYNG